MPFVGQTPKCYGHALPCSSSSSRFCSQVLRYYFCVGYLPPRLSAIEFQKHRSVNMLFVLFCLRWRYEVGAQHSECAQTSRPPYNHLSLAPNEIYRCERRRQSRGITVGNVNFLVFLPEIRKAKWKRPGGQGHPYPITIIFFIERLQDYLMLWQFTSNGVSLLPVTWAWCITAS